MHAITIAVSSYKYLPVVSGTGSLLSSMALVLLPPPLPQWVEVVRVIPLGLGSV